MSRSGTAAAVFLAVATATGAGAQVAPKSAAAAARAQGSTRKPATAASSAEFDSLAKRAQTAHAAHQLDDALELYRKALQLRPRWTEGRFALGAVLYDLDRYGDARTEFRRVTAEQPTSATAWAFLGMCEFQLHENEQALAHIQKGRVLGLTDNPSLKAVADYHVGILLTRFSEFEQARDILSNFALINEDSPSVIEALGLAAMRLPYLPPEAPPEKRELILIAGRAMFQFTRNRYSPTARLAFDELVTRFPDEPNAHYAKGAFLMSVEETEAGLAEFRRALELQPAHVPAMLQLAFHLMKEGRYEDARQYAESAVKAEPGFFAAHNALGRALLDLDQTDRAIAELEVAARLAPNSIQTFFSLARAYQKAGRTEDSRRARQTFMKLDAALKAEQEKTRGAATQSRSQQPEPPQE